MQEVLISQILSSGGFLVLNKFLLKQLGLQQTVLLSNIVDKYNFWIVQQQKEEFYVEDKEQVEQTGMSLHQIRETRKKLIELGLISVERKGIPPRHFYKIDFEAISIYFEKLKVLTSKNSKYNSNNRLNENKAFKEKIYKKEKPLPEDSKETFPDENQNPSRQINIKKADRIINYLNSITAKQFRYVESNRKYIIARLNDGYSYSDCIKVIENKSKDPWFIEKPHLINPTTLFRPANFENYLNFAPPPQKQIVGGKRLKMPRGDNGMVVWNMDNKWYNIDDTDTHPSDMKAWYRKEYPDEYKG